MLVLVRPIVTHYLRQVVEAGQRSDVEHDLAERSLERIRLGGCKSVQRDSMRGAQQHHAADLCAPASE